MKIHILQHSLGLDQYGRGTQYRNHFVTGPECDNYAECRALADAGLMVERQGNELSGGHSVFIVTPAGIAYVKANSPTPPKLTRSQLRYQRYLDYGDMFNNFRDFLRWDSNRGKCEPSQKEQTMSNQIEKYRPTMPPEVKDFWAKDAEALIHRYREAIERIKAEASKHATDETRDGWNWIWVVARCRAALRPEGGK